MSGLWSLVLAVELLSGCASQQAKTSKNADIPTSPPAGKALICIHRPKGSVGRQFYAPVWVDTRLIAALGNGQSVACICEPGKHDFLCLSAEITSCVQAELLANQTYDLWIDRYLGWWQNDFKIKPLHQDGKTRQLVAEWSKENHWVEAASSEAAHVQGYQSVQHLIEEFTVGKRHDKLQYLAPDDHR